MTNNLFYFLLVWFACTVFVAGLYMREHYQYDVIRTYRDFIVRFFLTITPASIIVAMIVIFLMCIHLLHSTLDFLDRKIDVIKNLFDKLDKEIEGPLKKILKTKQEL